MDCKDVHQANGVRRAELRASLAQVIARWRLTQSELQALLGSDCTAIGKVHPGSLTPVAAQRAWHLIKLDQGLTALFGDPDRVCAWLRTPTRAFDGLTTLEAMAEPAVLEALFRTVAPWGGLDIQRGGAWS